MVEEIRKQAWAMLFLVALAPAAGADAPPATDVLDSLAACGQWRAMVCPSADGGWVVVPGPPVEGIRLRWLPDGVEELHRDGSPDGSWETWIERAVDRRLTRLANEGRPTARVRYAGSRIDSFLAIDLEVEPGPVTVARELVFRGRRTTRESYLHRRLGWGGERVYRAREWNDAAATLLASDLFARVEGPILIADSLGAGDDSVGIHLLFLVEEAAVNRVGGLIGYSGEEERLFGFADLELGNLMGTGRAARVRWQAQQDLESRFHLAWHEPFVWRLPLEADLSLSHVIEDTLYAETTWGADLGWIARGAWRVSAGWHWGRLVIGGEDARRRHTGRIGVRRSAVGTDRGPAGWGVKVEIANTEDADLTLRRGRIEAREWWSWGRLGIWLAQDAALVSGADSLLRGDAFVIGGAESIRGTYEAAHRAFRYVIQRAEIGPRPPAGSETRFYALLDLGWLREWRGRAEDLYGGEGGNRLLWAAGVGVRAPSRLGEIRLDYAVPGGEPIWRGRIHFGVVGRF